MPLLRSLWCARRRMFLALCAVIFMIGGLAFTMAGHAVEASHRLTRAHVKPLMVISHARLARAEYNALELVLDRRAPGGAHQDERISELIQAITIGIEAAHHESPTQEALAAARVAGQAFLALRGLWESTPSPGQRNAIREQAARLLNALNTHDELMAEARSKARPRA